MALAKPFGIASIIGGVVLLMLAFAVGTSGGTAFAGEDTPTVENGDTTGTPSGDDGTTTPAAGGGDTTPTTGAGGISTPTPVGAADDDDDGAATPSAGGDLPDTGTGPGGSDASLLWLLGAGALAAGAGAVLVGTRQRG